MRGRHCCSEEKCFSLMYNITLSFIQHIQEDLAMNDLLVFKGKPSPKYKHSLIIYSPSQMYFFN